MISSPNTPLVYIGATTLKLSQRFFRHKAVSNPTRSKIIIESGDAVITAIDSIEDDDKEELDIKELEYIQFYKDICVNFRGTKDFYSKEYIEPCRLDGRHKKHQNTKNVCSVCGGRYTNSHKQRHFKSEKHISKLPNKKVL